MSKKKILLVILAVALAAAVLLGIWYFGVQRPKTASLSGERKTVTVNIEHTDGTALTKNLATTRSTLAELLEDEGLLVSEDQGYGLTIVALDGEEALIASNASWVFNVNGEPGMENVGDTILSDGDVFDFYVLTW